MLGADTSTCFETKFVQETKSVSESPPSVLEASGLTPTEKRLRTLKKKLQNIVGNLLSVCGYDEALCKKLCIIN